MPGVGVLTRAYVCRDSLTPSNFSDTIVQDLVTTLRGLPAVTVVHRDVKPANIVVERSSGRPFLVDFDCADQLGKEGFAGTDRFCSDRARAESCAQPEDDFESLDITVAWCLPDPSSETFRAGLHADHGGKHTMAILSSWVLDAFKEDAGDFE